MHGQSLQRAVYGLFFKIESARRLFFCTEYTVLESLLADVAEEVTSALFKHPQLANAVVLEYIRMSRRRK